MLERNIPHTYIERPGAHDSDYWKVSHKYQLFFFNEFFNKSPTMGRAEAGGSNTR